MSKRGYYLGGHSLEKGPTNLSRVGDRLFAESLEVTDAETDERERRQKAIENADMEVRARRDKRRQERSTTNPDT